MKTVIGGGTNENGTKPSRLKKVGEYCLILLMLFLLLGSCALWYVSSNSFQQMVRRRLIAEVERATGGRAELGSFHATPFRLQVEVRDLTVHGRESGVPSPAAQSPYIHVDSLVATVNLASVFGAKIGFHTLVLQHPAFHIIFYPDGSTNLPNPKHSGPADIEQLFSISIDRLDIRNGELLWQDQRFPLNFSSNDITATLRYSFLHLRYSGKLAVGRVDTLFDGYRPFAWRGEAGFSIDKSGVQVHWLKAALEGSKLQARGTVTNFAQPVFKGDYDLLLDIHQIGAISRQPQLKAGVLQINGSGVSSSETFSASGKFGVRSLWWQDQSFAARNATGFGSFSLDPQKISLSKIDGQLLHGTFAADVEIAEWRGRGSPGRARIAKGEQIGTINIKAKDFSVAELLAGMGPQFRPATKLRLAGNISGTSEIKWKESIRNAETKLAIEVARPSHVAPGEIPLTAAAHAIYSSRSGNLEISDLVANTPATQIQAAGTISSNGSSRFSVSTSDLREWQPITAELFPAGLPFTLRGHASFTGIGSGNGANLMLAGNLRAENFDVSIDRGAPATSEIVHWDSLNADLQVSSRNLVLRNAVLRHGDATIQAEGNAGLAAWKLAPSSRFRVHLDIKDADAGEIAMLSGYDHAISGKLAAQFDLSGTRSQPQAQGNFRLAQGRIQGQQFDDANGLVTVSGHEITFKDLHVARGATRIAGDGSYNRDSQAVRLNLAGSNFDLAELSPVLRSRIAIGGQLDFSAQVSGVIAEPEVTANVHVRGLTFNGETVGDYVLNGVSHGPELRLTGHSEFQNSELQLDGNIRLHDQWPARIGFHFKRLDIDSFLETYLHERVTGHSAVAGDLVLEGPLRDPQRLKVVANLTDLQADVEKIKFHNDGPIRFSLADREVKIESLHIVGDGTDLSGSGSMQLAGDRAMDFAAKGKVDLQLIHAYDPDITGSGTLRGEAHISGTLDAPLLRGTLQLQNAAIADANLPNALNELNGTLVFNQNQITIESLSGRSGGGTISFTGHSELTGRQLSFDLNANVNAVRLRYPPGVSSTANAQLRWNGTSSGSVLSGEITIIKLGFTPGFDFGAYLERTAQASSLPQTDPLLNKIRLDLHVLTTPDLQMRTSVIRLQGEADLRVRGNVAKPILLGRADVFEGEAYFNGAKYRLERGSVTFGTPTASNPAASVPLIELEATTRVRDYDITLSINGPADRPKLSYRSEPPLPTSDIIGLLAFGQTTEQSAQLQQSSSSAFSQQASNAMLAAALNATLNNRTQRLFGNSRIKIDPQGLATETSPTQTGPAVTIEQQVRDNFTLTYTTSVSQASQQIIRAEYNISKNVSVVAIRDQNGVVSFDVKIRRRKR
jgi:translocation and assembly module TamB